MAAERSGAAESFGEGGVVESSLLRFERSSCSTVRKGRYLFVAFEVESFVVPFVGLFEA